MRQMFQTVAILFVLGCASASAFDATGIAAISKAAESFATLAGDSAKTGRPARQTDPAAKPLLDLVFDTSEVQSAILYEEEPPPSSGRRYVGSAIWRTEMVSPGPGLAPELAVRTDVEIPERGMTMTWSLRHNTDQTQQASHTIEILFNLPGDLPGGGISNVPGILMKQSAQAHGTPLAGRVVKVRNGFFRAYLSAEETDVQRNVQLLKDDPWFAIAIVYTNGSRAILALEKGASGQRAFDQAFTAWDE